MKLCDRSFLHGIIISACVALSIQLYAVPSYTSLFGTGWGNVIHYSSDGGATWTNNTNLSSNWQTLTGLSEKPDGGARLYTITTTPLLTDKNNKKILVPKFFGTNISQQIYYTTNMGAQYAQTSGLLRTLAAAADGTLIGFNSDGDVYKSTDDGNTWQSVFNGNHHVMGVTIAPDDGTIYYISSREEQSTMIGQLIRAASSSREQQSTKIGQLIRSDSSGTAWEPVGNIGTCSTASQWPGAPMGYPPCVFLLRIAAGPEGVVWGLDKDNRLFRFTDRGTKGTEPYPDRRFRYITVALNGDLYGLTADGGGLMYLKNGTAAWETIGGPGLDTIHAAPWWPAYVAQDQEKCAEWCGAVVSANAQGDLSLRACKNACINSAQFNENVTKIMGKFGPKNAQERQKILSDCSADLNTIKGILDDALFEIAEGLVMLKTTQQDKQKIIATMDRVKKAGDRTIAALETSLANCKKG